MKEEILVAYASKYGSTKEVALVVAGVIREKGLSADVQPIAKIRNASGYRRMVLGAPLYFGRWPAEMRSFLNRNREALILRPPAVFALGPTGSDFAEWEGVRRQFEKELKMFPWLAPRSAELFGGKYDPTRLRFPDTLIANLAASPLHGLPASDARDWEKIRAWARKLYDEFSSGT